jgi:5-methyltetrahydrofolate--homocysteine methyltransferase
MSLPKHPLLTELEKKLSDQILILDGAMGTMIQQCHFTEADYRGERYRDHNIDLKGNNDILVFTQADQIRRIHLEYLEAGADIIETNTFNANRISQLDFNLQNDCFEMNRVAAEIALQAVAEFNKKNSRPVYVAGSIGPTNRTASLSPDVNRPAFRNVSFDELVGAYDEQIRGLMAGGVFLLLPETTFDTLNLKACLFAIQKIETEMNCKLPLMISITLTDSSGRTLSGQTMEACWNSVRHAKPLSMGLNCALGAKEMRPFLIELARSVDCFVSCYPNAGLPNPLSLTGYDETPEMTAGFIKNFADQKLVNIVGGCCGTTPAHIEAIALALKSEKPRKWTAIKPTLRLSGLEALNLSQDKDRPLVMIGERTNVTGSPKFAEAVRAGDRDKMLTIARQQVENGANIIDINFDEGMAKRG